MKPAAWCQEKERLGWCVRARAALSAACTPLQYAFQPATASATLAHVDRRLAGDLSVWRARWLVIRRRPGAFWPSFSRWRGRPERANEQHQAELFDLVLLTTRRLGITMPDRVRLVGTAEVTARASRRGCLLLLGLPLVDGLTGPELSALIAHELSVTGQPYPWLTGHLLAACRAALDNNAYRALCRRAPKRRDTALLAATAAWYTAVEQAADEAAVLATDRPTAARAVALGWLLADEFDSFLLSDSSAALPLAFLWGYAIDDLAAGWRLRLSAGIDDADTVWDEECAADLAVRHPGLAGQLAALGSQPLDLGLPANPVSLEPMTRRQRRRLVRQALDLEPQRFYRWRTFQELPDRYWRKDIAASGKQIRTAVLTVLRTDHASPATIADTILRRPTEVAACLIKLYCPPGIDPPTPDDVDPTALLAPFIEATLYERGWRRDHPLTEDVLTGPDGQHIDTGDLAARAAADPFALAELHRLLAHR